MSNKSPWRRKPYRQSNEELSGDELLKAARDSAYRLLARREHAASELQQKLRLRDFSHEVCANLLAELIEDGLQSDERYAESRCRQRISQGYGPMRLRAELREKRISDEIISTHLDSVDEFLWREYARSQRLRRFGEELPPYGNELARQQRHLAQRGFTHSQVRAAFQPESSD